MAEGIIGTVARTVVGLLVVVAELQQHIVTRFQQAAYLGPAVLRQERGNRQTAFGIVGNRDPVGQEVRNHLAPRGPGLVALVNHRTVAAQVQGRDRCFGFNLQALHGRSIAVELDGEFLVPVQFADFVRLDLHLVGLALGIGKVKVPLIDHKRNGLELALLRRQILHIQAAALAAHGGYGCAFFAA